MSPADETLAPAGRSSDGQRAWSRGSLLRVAAGTGGALLGGLLVGRTVGGADAAPSRAQDRQIFQFALLLEELQRGS